MVRIDENIVIAGAEPQVPGQLPPVMIAPEDARALAALAIQDENYGFRRGQWVMAPNGRGQVEGRATDSSGATTTYLRGPSGAVMIIVHLDGKNTSCLYPADKVTILPEPDDSEVEVMVPLSTLSIGAAPATPHIEVTPPVVGSVTAGGDENPIIS